ncbi:hypothetical protein GM3709_2293 [Geminocystis sp. NIES-3709]|nr:hypothetical protein GM3709_2293 [Geminocystis sp. NIES-3709]
MSSGSAINISTDVPSGAETYSYRILTFLGEAAILANGGNDIPMINAYAEKRTGYVRTVVDGYEYGIEDLESAEYAGMNIDSSMAIGAREVIERKVDLLAYNGDSNFNLLGFLNYPNVPFYTIPNDGTGSSTTFATKTPEQIYRDLREFVSATRIATAGVETPEILALPIDQFDRVMQTPYPTNSASGETIGSFFLKTQRMTPGGIQAMIPMAYLEGRGTGGLDMMVAYRKRLDKLKLHIPLDFEQMPVQQKDLDFRVVCRMRTGGVQINKPLALRYAEGI